MYLYDHPTSRLCVGLGFAKARKQASAMAYRQDHPQESYSHWNNKACKTELRAGTPCSKLGADALLEQKRIDADMLFPYKSL